MMKVCLPPPNTTQFDKSCLVCYLEYTKQHAFASVIQLYPRCAVQRQMEHSGLLELAFIQRPEGVV